MRRRPAPATAILVLLALPITLRAQEDAGGRGSATRAGLDSLLNHYEAAGRSTAYSAELREEAAREAARIRDRLTAGDFRAGDRVMLTVENEAELSDSFPVVEGPALNLPGLGRVSLSGVLRSELNEYLTREIGRFVRDPVVRTRTLIRLLFTGEIRQGFYTVPSSLPFTEAMMLAGGPTPQAKLTEIRVERDNRIIWDGQRLQDAIIEGRTLDEMNLQAGDRVVIPRRAQGLGALESPLRAFTLLLTIPAAVLGTIAIF